MFEGSTLAWFRHFWKLQLYLAIKTAESQVWMGQLQGCSLAQFPRLFQARTGPNLGTAGAGTVPRKAG